MGLLDALGRASGPPLFTGTYAATVGVFPQAYFVVHVACFGLAWTVTWFVKPGGEYCALPGVSLQNAVDDELNCTNQTPQTALEPIE